MVNQISKTEDFKAVIAQDKLVVVDFFATWCGPCKAIAPKVEQFSKTYSNAEFIKVDVDELSEIAAEAGVHAMPSFFLYKKGQKVAEVVGANPAKLEAVIKENL
ncbi:cytosolic thioredoxin Trx1 [Schizosaccharomyces cryophilus OY26]|uniref:Thioredoxin n=1 Tax=Schizosaccharomyces cryophilus (strain OY26 / ATCC MYA-4695 / CBS 11777 / NBRC 106824 / NRRL Y48691) TaxID=653667 RepID=S9W3A9_SCHCR|nr:cytosolic thioredoxin Trx1 [Schizosaccharomyces cryophilus OY26]EPY52430.1 cytosolic thioredoxin Trx1 [Schizosaccharomyces cryophilus OY26]